jgi:hypothetical protein
MRARSANAAAPIESKIWYARPSCSQRHAGAAGGASTCTRPYWGGGLAEAEQIGGSERVLPCFSIIPRDAIEQRGRCGPTARCGTTGSVMQAGL